MLCFLLMDVGQVIHLWLLRARADEGNGRQDLLNENWPRRKIHHILNPGPRSCGDGDPPIRRPVHVGPFLTHSLTLVHGVALRRREGETATGDRRTS